MRLRMKFVELFAGIGGFRHGLESVCFENSTEQEEGTGNKKGQFIQQSDKCSNRYTCVWSNEIDKYACQIYRKNFGKGELYEGDITTVNTRNIPDHELLVGGFPCQAFSIAGKRRGFDDTRGTLFFEIERICRAKKPRYILLENVKGLLSHDSGRTFQTILKVLTDIGYILQWEVLNSKNFGVPQNRERVFIVGYLRGTSRPEVFPIGKTIKNNIQQTEKLLMQISNTLRTNYSNGKANETYIGELDYVGAVMSEKNKKWLENGKELSRNFPQGQRIYTDKGIASTIAGNAGGLGGKTGLYKISPCIRAEHHNTADVHFVPQNMKIRRLTPTECERLQGFPDGWTEGISDTQRYKCLGNAVTTSVVTEIGKRLYDIQDNRSK